MAIDNSRIEKKIVALAAANPSLTHAQIATMVDRSTKTVQRALHANRDVIEEVENDLLNELQSHLETLHTMEDAALNYVDLATSAKNEAVRLGAQDRILDIRGIITDKERLRSKGVEHAASAPMFALGAGAQVNVTIQQTVTKPAATSYIEDVQPLQVEPEKFT